MNSVTIVALVFLDLLAIIAIMWCRAKNMFNGAAFSSGCLKVFLRLDLVIVVCSVIECCSPRLHRLGIFRSVVSASSMSRLKPRLAHHFRTSDVALGVLHCDHHFYAHLCRLVGQNDIEKLVDGLGFSVPAF